MVLIPFARTMHFDYGASQRLSPLVRRVVADNPGPFTYMGTGVYIVGRGEVAVIDPGPDDPKHLAALKRALEGERVAAILVTHRHLDHSPAARPLAAATGATIYASGVAPRFSPDDFVAEAGDDLGFTPDVAIRDNVRISAPSWSLEAIATPGHTSDHLCFALAEENALFSGDHIMGWSTTVISPPDGDMDDYLASLDKVRARNFTTLYPTHGPPIGPATYRNAGVFIDAYKLHRLEREAQILAQLKGGPRRIADMVPVIYAETDQRLWPAAMHSVLAHMIRLVKHDRVRCDGAPAIDSLYALT